MSRKRRKHRKHFPCGHRGFGRYCHCCYERQQKALTKAAVIEARSLARQQWQASFRQDEIDLLGLPKKIVLKARDMLLKLAAGQGFWQFRGKRFHFDRTLITIPVTRRYRLLCRDDDRPSLTPLSLLSHETYNAVARDRVGVKG